MALGTENDIIFDSGCYVMPRYPGRHLPFAITGWGYYFKIVVP